MHPHLEESLQHDINRIRDNVAEMSQRAEKALHDCIKSFVDNNRQMAYAIILRDQYIDEKEKEIDRLCLEFIVRQQPVAQPLRFAYSTIKINLEIERVGDYAESVSRQVLKLGDWQRTELRDRIVEQAMVSIGMFHDAIAAFLNQDLVLAKKSIEVKETADALRVRLNETILQLFNEKKIDLDIMEPLMTITRRFERVADQARNICLEVLYLCTGEYAKHPGADTFRILFVDKHNSGLSQMAEAIALSLQQSKFIFNSAGLEPRPIERSVIDFMQTKGFDLSRMAPKSLFQVPHLEHYQVIVALCQDVYQAFPSQHGKVIFLDWAVVDPATVAGPPENQLPAFEKAFNSLSSQVHDLVGAIIGTDTDKERKSV